MIKTADELGYHAVGAWCVIVCAPDSDQARRTRGRWLPSTSPRCRTSSSSATASTQRTRRRSRRRSQRGDLDAAFELTSPDVADTLSITGSPEACVAKIEEIESTGVKHMILCVTDPAIVKAFTGKDVSMPDVKGQLQLIHDEVMPAFA